MTGMSPPPESLLSEIVSYHSWTPTLTKICKGLVLGELVSEPAKNGLDLQSQWKLEELLTNHLDLSRHLVILTYFTTPFYAGEQSTVLAMTSFESALGEDFPRTQSKQGQISPELLPLPKEERAGLPSPQALLLLKTKKTWWRSIEVKETCESNYFAAAPK